MKTNLVCKFMLPKPIVGSSLQCVKYVSIHLFGERNKLDVGSCSGSFGRAVATTTGVCGSNLNIGKYYIPVLSTVLNTELVKNKM